MIGKQGKSSTAPQGTSKKKKKEKKASKGAQSKTKVLSPKATKKGARLK